MRPTCLILVLSFMLKIPNAAHAAPSDLMKQFNQYMVQHHYVAVKLSSGGMNQQFLRVVINDKKVKLQVDTGCPDTQLTYRCARSLGLALHDLGRHEDGVGGEIQGDESMALMNSFRVSSFEINRTNTVHILSRKAIMDDADGLFGLDFLLLNSAIYPVGASGVLLKPGPTPPANIRDFMKHMGFTGVPLSVFNGGLYVEGHLNGKTLRLLIDSGAELSIFSARAIKEALGNGIEATALIGSGLDGHSIEQFQFTPNVIKLGEFPVSHEILLASYAATFSREGCDGLVGFDLLGSHNAIIDLGDGVLWMKQ